MNFRQSRLIIKEFGDILNISPDPFALDSEEYDHAGLTYSKPDNFLRDLIETGGKYGIIFTRSAITRKDLSETLADLNFPILIFEKRDGEVIPVIIKPRKKERGAPYAVVQDIDNDSAYLEALPEFDCHSDLIVCEEGEPIIVTAVPYRSLVSEEGDNEEKPGPVKRFLRLLQAEKQDIIYIYIYAIFVGLISLALPLGIQAIIGLISGGMQLNSILLLTIGVVVAILISGGLQIMQVSMVEILQQRIFAKAAFEFAYRIPRLRTESLRMYYPPELMNRFFDVMTIQKGLPKILIEISAAVLQIFFGLILLAFYHPFFIAFGFFLVFVLTVIFYITGPKGLKTSLVESKYKYKVAYWLEELARALHSFKISGTSWLPIRRMDSNVNYYLKERKAHFRVLISQFSYIVLFKVAVTGGLLIIGAVLVIQQQITLGQFVASEIVIILITGAVEKVILNMDTVYDVLTAVEKVGTVTDLPTEKCAGVKLENENKGLSLHVKDLHYTYEQDRGKALDGLSINIHPGERVGITGVSNSGRTTFLNIISGLFMNYKGIVSYDDVNLRDLDIPILHDQLAKNVTQEDIFDGTILENILVGKPDRNYRDAVEALKSVHLLDYVNALPDGLSTVMISGGKNFPKSILSRIILARCLAKKPRMMIIEDFFQNFSPSEKLELLQVVFNKDRAWSLIVVSSDPGVLAYCDRVAVMKEGKICNEGTFDSLLKEGKLKDILPSDSSHA
ncbi:peptidase domain-containing ABC transporter [Roseivirga sp. BDSF3-8]|uniref:peptidase domain-containing ABC transporter n=1 Tax=Roseivirga sp. BDSF3-8 TaxID=3241598 RepID=UPI003531EAE0